MFTINSVSNDRNWKFRYSIFMRLQKEQQIENKQKISYTLPDNTFEAVKPY